LVGRFVGKLVHLLTLKKIAPSGVAKKNSKEKNRKEWHATFIFSLGARLHGASPNRPLTILHAASPIRRLTILQAASSLPCPLPCLSALEPWIPGATRSLDRESRGGMEVHVIPIVEGPLWVQMCLAGSWQRRPTRLYGPPPSAAPLAEDLHSLTSSPCCHLPSVLFDCLIHA
jgi:hypothetical protein